MQLLVAAQDIEPGFSYTVPGELVLLGVVCARDEYGDRSCGCRRAFSGVVTGRATTLAVCKEMELDRADLVSILRDTFASDRWIFSPEHAEMFAEDMIETAGGFPVGTAVRRDLDVVIAA